MTNFDMKLRALIRQEEQEGYKVLLVNNNMFIGGYLEALYCHIGKRDSKMAMSIIDYMKDKKEVVRAEFENIKLRPLSLINIDKITFKEE